MQITKEYNGKPVEVYGNLGQLHTFESLNEDVQNKLIELFGFNPRHRLNAFTSTAVFTEAQMIDAYEAGFDDAREQMSEPRFDKRSAQEYIRMFFGNGIPN